MKDLNVMIFRIEDTDSNRFVPVESSVRNMQRLCFR